MKRIKDLYDLYVEEMKNNEMPIIAPEEKKYIRVWSELQPIEEYFIILDNKKAKYYRVKKYEDKEILNLVAVYDSMVRALCVAEKYDYCKNIAVEDYNFYKDAEYIERIIEE